MMLRGVVDKREDQYSLAERLHLIQCLEIWRANLYVFGQVSWSDSTKPLSADVRSEFQTIQRACSEHEIDLWAWMKPGDHRYACHRLDRQRFIENAMWYVELGADGFYLLMDDMHRKTAENPHGHVRVKDAEVHALLIAELADALGEKFRGICGQHYSGSIPGAYKAYWSAILDALPKHVMITWVGPKTWNKRLCASEVPDPGHPILLWDNYFASDSTDPMRAPVCPYAGRDPELVNALAGVVIHPDAHYPWQYCNLAAAMDFWRDPKAYDPQRSFKRAVQQLGDAYWEQSSRKIRESH